jgi:hypothetical protein
MRPSDEAVAGGLQTSVDSSHLGFVDDWDCADIVNGSARNPQFVSDERNDLLTWYGAALRLAVKSNDTCVTLTIQSNNHIRSRGDGRRRRRRSACRLPATDKQNQTDRGNKHCAKAHHGRR